jgi:nucleoside-diphosphate-sugar epimerase
MTLMRVYVTGAGRGFVGAHVIEALREAGHEVRDRGADVRELVPLRRVVDGCEAVCHVAALSSYTAPATELEAANVLGTANVVEAYRRAGVGRLVHTSTCGTCGPVAGRPATEADGPPEWSSRCRTSGRSWRRSGLRSRLERCA